MNKHIKEISLAAASGILTALAFPKLSFIFLGWLSLIPLLYVLQSQKPGRSFFLGWCGGSVFYLILLYWIQAVPAYYGGLPWLLSALIFVLFAVFLGLFWAVFAWLYSRILPVFPKSAFVLGGLLWVVQEYTLTHLLTGFPWGLLGYSQYKNLAFIQISAVSGIYGLSFLLFLFQSSFVASLTRRKKTPFYPILALILAVHLGGWLTLQQEVPRNEETFRGAVIQGNIQPETDFSLQPLQETTALFQRHLELSRQACTQGAQFVVWAELSVPLCFSCSYAFFPLFSQELKTFSREQKCTLLLGTNETAFTQGEPQYYNTTVNLTPDAELSFYYKMHLVPFGEYTPYKRIFSFIDNFTHAIGELTPGESYVLHEFSGIRYGTPICYEVIFPDISRIFVREGARFLVTITNDGWYGRSWAPYQHFAMAVLRAAENRRFLLRSATTGISGIIDPYGRILSRTSLDTTAVLTGDITPLSGRTLYVRFGNWLVWVSLTLSGVFLILAGISRKRHEKKQQR